MLTLLLALLLAVAPSSSATSVARISADLASDTERLATARRELDAVRSRQRSAGREHRRIRGEVESRLVSIYKHGTAAEALAAIAG
ncbi:MAG: hypothetical protein JWO69_149, partial [Thermoleophilia bacterium]|nr:hypothetical protein [Thermoleophilia bacterium]